MKKKTITLIEDIIFGIIIGIFSLILSIAFIATMCGDGNKGLLDILS